MRRAFLSVLTTTTLFAVLGCKAKPEPTLQGFTIGEALEQFTKTAVRLPSVLAHTGTEPFSGQFSCWDISEASNEAFKDDCLIHGERLFEGVLVSFTNGKLTMIRTSTPPDLDGKSINWNLLLAVLTEKFGPADTNSTPDKYSWTTRKRVVYAYRARTFSPYLNYPAGGFMMQENAVATTSGIAKDMRFP
jgi:hypothetical protein